MCTSRADEADEPLPDGTRDRQAGRPAPSAPRICSVGHSTIDARPRAGRRASRHVHAAGEPRDQAPSDGTRRRRAGCFGCPRAPHVHRGVQRRGPRGPMSIQPGWGPGMARVEVRGTSARRSRDSRRCRGRHATAGRAGVRAARPRARPAPPARPPPRAAASAARPAPPATLTPMKGLVLAGGTATRLFPLTIVTNKHLLPIYDRPMIYYPLDTLAGMGIRETMVIVGGKSVGDIVELLGDGRHFGLDLTYRYQRGALGIAHAIGLARDFIGDDSFCVVLGDNILRGPALAEHGGGLRRGRLGRRHAPLPRPGPAALRRGGAGRERPRRGLRGEAGAAQERPDPDRRVLPAPGRVRRDRDARALRPRRVRDHRRPEPLHPGRRPVRAGLRGPLGGRGHRPVAAAGGRAGGGRRRGGHAGAARRRTRSTPK